MKPLANLLALPWHALKSLVRLIGDLVSLAVDLAMPAIFSGAALSLATAVTASVSPALGRLVMSGTTVLVLVGIALWAHLARRWWTP